MTTTTTTKTPKSASSSSHTAQEARVVRNVCLRRRYVCIVSFSVTFGTAIYNYGRSWTSLSVMRQNHSTPSPSELSGFPPRLVDQHQGGRSSFDNIYDKQPARTIKITTRTADQVWNLTQQNATKTNKTNQTSYCVPIAPWQTSHYPTGSLLHENFDAASLLIKNTLQLSSTKGFWRLVWRLRLSSSIRHMDVAMDRRLLHRLGQDKDGGIPLEKRGANYMVFKTLRLEHPYTRTIFHSQQIDAVAMERLSSSLYVMDMYGFAGMTVMSEYATLTLSYAVSKRLNTALHHVNFARDVARGVASVHHGGGTGGVHMDVHVQKQKEEVALMVHNDLNPANVVVVEYLVKHPRTNATNVLAIPKLNDFNIAILQEWHVDTKEVCPFYGQFANAQWRAPEEQPRPISTNAIPHQNHNHNHNHNHNQTFSTLPLNESIDVYSMANIFYRILTHHDVWREYSRLPNGKGGITSEDKARLANVKREGALPQMADDYEDTWHKIWSKTSSFQKKKEKERRFVYGLEKVMWSCFATNPRERPTAKEVVKKLTMVLEDEEHEEGGGAGGVE